jgi:hypothetical protein
MFDDIARKLAEDAVSTYCATHMHQELPSFKCSPVYSAYKKDAKEELKYWEGQKQVFNLAVISSILHLASFCM